MMRVYPLTLSVHAGEELKLCVEPGHRFRVAFYRYWLSDEAQLTAAPEFSQTCGVEQGNDIFQSPYRPWYGKPDREWEWPWISYRLNSSDWPSGVYAALVYEVDDLGIPTDEIGRSAVAGSTLGFLSSNAAMFVVTPRSPTASIAYIVPIATYHAYNFTGGGCFYEYREPPAAPCRTVTLRRPGCGIGGVSREALDPYDKASPRQAFTHWDAKMIGWMRREGFAVDCFTDLDLDQKKFLVDISANAPLYRLVISAGHHEYWSETMRDRIQGLLNVGGNFATFSGNTCYRKISFDAAGMSVTKENECWPDSNEARLLGVSYSQGGGWWGVRDGGQWRRTERPAIGYTVAAPQHWVFAGVKLPQDGIFGAAERLIGYECDGIVPNVSPENVIVLAKALLQGGWNNGDGHTSSMVTFGSGQGTVFNAATTDWARVLADPATESYDAVSQITRNILEKLSGLKGGGNRGTHVAE